MGILRAKFKTKEQLEKDLERFNRDKFIENINKLPDNIRFVLTADDCDSNGLLDIELYVKGKSGYKYTLESPETEIVQFSSKQCEFEDAVEFTLTDCKEKHKDIFESLFNHEKHYLICVKVLNPTDLPVDNFGAFKNLQCRVYINNNTEEFQKFDFEYCSINKEMILYNLQFKSDGTWRLVLEYEILH